MKRKLLLVFFLLSSNFCSDGCTCYPPYYFNFFDAISLHPLFYESDNNIVLARIVSFSDNYNFMRVEILEELSGKLVNFSSIIAGQDGFNCAVPLNNGFFHPNDTLIFFLIPDFEGRNDTLELNDCSLSYLKFSNNKVLGNISATQTEMDYESFKEELKLYLNNPEISNDLNNYFKFYPNPTNETFCIEINPLITNKEISIKLLNSIGQIVKEIRFLKPIISNISYIDISHLQTGVYYLMFSIDNVQSIKKIIIL